MSSIVTITFNPCIDKNVELSALIPEKKLRCAAPLMQPGGGGINVARAITNLGGRAIAVYPAGGYYGSLLTKLLNDERVTTLPVAIKGETRENWIINEQSTNKQFRLGMPGPVISTTEYNNCLREVEQLDKIDFIVVSGSLPEGIPPGVFEQVASIANRKKAKLIVDTSGDALQSALESGAVYLVKPSMSELQSLIKGFNLPAYSVTDAALEIIARGYCQVVVVSMGADGVILATHDMLMTLTPPDVRKVSTVGAGDSTVAGIILSLSQNKTIEDAVAYGVACGTAAIMNPGTSLCKLKDVETILPQITKKIKRIYTL